ncbi:MAG TPA: hypothetical protein VNL17_14445 [Verrucomicrobiae bacterium]|nr:hypothetical protein [Verrucomicrobiae bacterium]
MTTVDIETQADPDGLATTSLNLKFVLRHKVVPDFYSVPDSSQAGGMGGVGYVGWRRKSISQAITQGQQTFDLPDDFGTMKTISLGIASINNQLEFETHELSYIGDNPTLVMMAESATVQVQPTGWYLVWTSASGGHPAGYRTVKFDAPSDAAYTCRAVYYNQINFADDTTSVDLNVYIPQPYQWALVCGLQRELYATRLSQGDDRYQRADSEYRRIINQARRNMEHTAQHKPKIIR